SGGRSLDGKSRLTFSRPAAWLAGLGLAAVLLIAFSPLARPWALLRRRARSRLSLGTRAGGRPDVAAVLQEWGMNPGDPRAAKQAGEPAGQKEYEGGDSLASARPATLYPFAGGAAVLPPRRPVVRRRRVSRAMEAVILIDGTPGLLVPPSGGKPE